MEEECDDIYEDDVNDEENFEFDVSYYFLTTIIQCISHNNNYYPTAAEKWKNNTTNKFCISENPVKGSNVSKIFFVVNIFLGLEICRSCPISHLEQTNYNYYCRTQ